MWTRTKPRLQLPLPAHSAASTLRRRRRLHPPPPPPPPLPDAPQLDEPPPGAPPPERSTLRATTPDAPPLDVLPLDVPRRAATRYPRCATAPPLAPPTTATATPPRCRSPSCHRPRFNCCRCRLSFATAIATTVVAAVAARPPPLAPRASHPTLSDVHRASRRRCARSARRDRDPRAPAVCPIWAQVHQVRTGGGGTYEREACIFRVMGACVCARVRVVGRLVFFYQ